MSGIVISVAPDIVKASVNIQKPKPRKFFAQVMFIYLYFVLIFSLINYVSLSFIGIVTGFAIYLLIGVGQYILAQSLHEAWHYYFFGRWKMLSRFLISYPLSIPISARIAHFSHHRNFGDSENDPDFMSYSGFPKTKYGFLKFLMFGLSGCSAILRFIQLIKAPVRSGIISSKVNIFSEIISILMVHILIFLLFSIFSKWYYYLLFWVMPVLTIVKILVNLRLIAEHGNLKAGTRFRTFLSNSLSTKLVGAFGFANHAEHHLFPNVCSFQLPEITTFILEKKIGDHSISSVDCEYTRLSHFRYLYQIYCSLD